MALELVTPLPPGAPSHTRLAKHGVRLVVLREIKDGTDCSWPQPSPNMVTLQEVGELQGKRHALFPWVPGVTLREVVKALEDSGNPIPLGMVGRVLIDCARSLAGITPARPHGGVQDAAMQIGFDGQVSVLDFGAPRISRFRPIGRVNFAADVFALGGVLHAVLTGFQGDYANPPATLPVPSSSHPEATPAIDDVVMRALSAQPDSRQADAATFADELETVLGSSLFTGAQLADVVGPLFKDRIKLIHSLGGLIEDHPDLEAVLPLPTQAIPTGTQPGTPGPELQPPSEPTLPRIALGDEPAERTSPRIPAPTAVVRAMVPWDSGSGLSPAKKEVDAETNPGVVLPEGRRVTRDQATTIPLASLKRPLPSDTDETSEPRAEPLRPRTPRPLGDEEGHAPTRAGGPRAISRNEESEARTSATKIPEDTNPEIKGSDDTAPRAPRLFQENDEPSETGPRPGPQPKPRNTTEAERQRALGQERLTTPPAGVKKAAFVPTEEDEALLDEPTAVRERPAPKQTVQTAQTAQTLPPAPAPAPKPPSGLALPIVMVVLLVVVVGLAAAVLVKLKRQSELPLPVDESVLEVDAGTAPAIALAVEVDGGDEEEEEEDVDGGEPDTVDAGAAAAIDAGASDAGAQVVKKPVKKPVKKKTKKKRR